MDTNDTGVAAEPTVMLVSLDDLDARKAGEKPFTFEYIKADGSRSGLTFSVLGTHCETVTNEINRLVNDRRREEAAAAAEAAASRQPEGFTPVESDIAFGQRLAAVRLVGWEGIKEKFTPALGLRLCQSNPDIAAQITAQSNKLANFMSGSPRTS
jgi:hypothetical protein